MSLSALFALFLILNLVPTGTNTRSAAANDFVLSSPGAEFQVSAVAAITETIFLPSISNPLELKPIGPSKLLFISDRAKALEFDIYSMNLDGVVQPLATINYKRIDYVPLKIWPIPVWSPDGNKIAFIDDSILYVMNADGSNLEAVVDDTDFRARGEPSWSPDGSTIAFVTLKCTDPPTCRSYTSDGSGVSIYQLDSDEVELLIDLNTIISDYVPPQWLPDGSGVLAVSAQGHNSYLVRGYLEGSSGHFFVKGFSEFDPFKISPDGSQIAYENGDLFVMNIDGSDKQMIHDSSSLEKSVISDFSWHPNGQEIAMAVFKDVIPNRLSEIHVLDVANSHTVHLTAHDPTSTKLLVGWIGDGSQLIYMSDVNRTQWAFDIYAMDEDGGNPVNLTANSPLDDRATDIFP